MKGKKITKREIHAIIRSRNITAIWRLASNFIDFSRLSPAARKTAVFNFLKYYAPNHKYRILAYTFSYGRASSKEWKRNFEYYVPADKMLVADFMRDFRFELNSGLSPYSKILFRGKRYYYWCSPFHGLSDYNKSIAFPINDLTDRLYCLSIDIFLRHGFIG